MSGAEVQERLEERFKEPVVQWGMARRLRRYTQVIGDGDMIALHKADIELRSVLNFGEDCQTLDLRRRIQLSPKDSELIEAFAKISPLLASQDIASARKELGAIPRPLGSACDRGEFDGYNHEVLFSISSAIKELLRLLPSSESELRARKREKASASMALLTDLIVNGLTSGNNRIDLIRGRFCLYTLEGNLLRPETLLERSWRTLRREPTPTPVSSY